jgi:hypothetical protein
MSKSNPSDPVESGLQPSRHVFTEETTPGEPPSDPEFQRYSGELEEVTASIDGGKEATESLGDRDFVEQYRSNEESELTVSYYQYDFPLSSTGDIVDPVGFTMELPNGDFPTLTHVSRRDVRGGGKLGAGFREYLVAFGCRPVSATLDGDPSAAEAIPQELTMPAETIRPHIIHQPDSATELVVRSTDDTDTNEIVIEDEGATTTSTLTLPGTSPNTVVTTATFDDIDSVFVRGEHAGDIQLGTDNGSGSIDTELLEKPLTGSKTDGVSSVEGIPPLGGGSVESPPTGQGNVFLGTQASFDGSPVAPRLHTLDLSVELDTAREAVQSSRRTEIDVGQRTVEFSADVAGPFQSASKIKAHFRDVSGDLVYAFGAPGTTPSNADRRIVAHNVEIISSPDHQRSAGDTNYIPSVTFRAVSDENNPAIEMINNS